MSCHLTVNLSISKSFVNLSKSISDGASQHFTLKWYKMSKIAGSVKCKQTYIMRSVHSAHVTELVVVNGGMSRGMHSRGPGFFLCPYFVEEGW